jgi:hypothetical protein
MTNRFSKEADIRSNWYVEGMWRTHGVLAINDLNISDARLAKLIRPLARKHKRVPVKVVSFSKAAKKLIAHVKKVDPDLIILPLRGAFVFAGMVPVEMRGRIHFFDISEHNAPDVRLTALSKLVQRIRAEKPRKIVWLDDEIFQGAQSKATQDVIDDYHPTGAFELHRLVLSSHELREFFGGPKCIRAVKPTGLVPMLASKWLRLAAKKAEDEISVDGKREYNRIKKAIARLNSGKLSGRP